MFVKNINSSIPQKPVFKGYEVKSRDDGEFIYDFNYPFDSNKFDCYLEIFSVNQDKFLNYSTGIKRKYTNQEGQSFSELKINPNGVKINLEENYNIKPNMPFAYRYKLVDKNGNITYKTDCGTKISKSNNESLNLVTSNNSTHVLSRGSMYLAIPDSFNPEYAYRDFNSTKTGEIIKTLKPNLNTLRTFSNKYDGNIAGLEQKIPLLKQNGYKRLLSTPILSGDNVSSHHYWNKNNMQVAPDLGNINNFASLQKMMFRNGMNFVSDGVFTSEGLEGVHFQYAMRWLNSGKDPQSLYWFRMNNSKSNQIGYGVIPENNKNLRHRLVNSPNNYDYNVTSGKITITPNTEYGPKQPTYIQIYDKSQVSDKQLKNTKSLIKSYDNLATQNELEFNTHNDTIIPYRFIFDAKDYEQNLEKLKDTNNKSDIKITKDSAAGTEFLVQNSAFKLIPKFEGGTNNWDANSDIIKMNYAVTDFDKRIYDNLSSKEKDIIEQKNNIGTYEVQDLAVSAGKYWTRKTRDINIEYAAKTLGKVSADNADAKINSLTNTTTDDPFNNSIKIQLLPDEVKFNNPDGAKKLIKSSSDTSNKNFKDVLQESLMNLPLDTLEFADDTVGVLSTSYFTNRATSKELVGLSRYQIEKLGNPQLKLPELNNEYGNTYRKMNSLFNNEITVFANKILEKINSTSDEKLFDTNKNLTKYGECVIPLIAEDIAKFAIIRAVVQNSDAKIANGNQIIITKDKNGHEQLAKILDNGEITYDYDFLKDKVTLNYLNVDGDSPKNEAEILVTKISAGLKKLNNNDINFVSNSITKRLEGTNKNSFILAENMVKRSGLGLDWRLDAAKDIGDMDSIRDRVENTENAWENVTEFWKKFTENVKEYNPSSYFIAEITDMDELYGASTNWKRNPIDNSKFATGADAVKKLISEAGITSEANYPYFFTNMISIFSNRFEDGGKGYDNPIYKAKVMSEKLLPEFLNNSLDYIKNSYTFVGNHDKPRMLHCLAMDMGLFHSKLTDEVSRKKALMVTNGIGAPADNNIDNINLPENLKSHIYDKNNSCFNNMSSKAVAMGYLLSSNINKSTLNGSEKQILFNSIADIVNGNYNYTEDNNSSFGTFTSLNYVLDKLNKNSSFPLSEKSMDILVNKTKKLLNDYSFLNSKKLLGDFSTKLNRETALLLLTEKMFAKELTESDSAKYPNLENFVSIKSVETANTVRAALSVALNSLSDVLPEFGVSSNIGKIYGDIYKAVGDLILDMSKETQKTNSVTDTNKKLAEKNGFGSKPIDTTIDIVFKHAKNKYGLNISDESYVKQKIYETIMKPAFAKSKMLMKYLVALPGNPTLFGGDELGMTGYEEPCKNVYLQNRNAQKWDLIKSQGINKKFYDEMTDIMKLRSNEKLRALNDGTPYKLNDQTIVNKIYENTDSSYPPVIPAYMMHSSDGAMTVSLFNSHGVEESNTGNFIPFNVELKEIYLGPDNAVTLTPGTKFHNASKNDNSVYEVVLDNTGKHYFLKKTDKSNIILDPKTAPDGVMILYHEPTKKTANYSFKGNINQQFNYSFNGYDYTKKGNTKLGQNLSIISR